jgi:succinyl-CoA synthetase alpha subunit
VLDMVKVKRTLHGSKSRLIGPNCPASSRRASARSASCRATSTSAADRHHLALGTLTYEAVAQTTAVGLGQTTVHRHRRRSGERHHFVECLEMLLPDPETEGIVMIGEIGGDAEARPPNTSRPRRPASRWSASRRPHRAAGRRMGHCRRGHSPVVTTRGIQGRSLRSAGIKVADRPPHWGGMP